MINVEFFSGINGLCGFEATGHSMSADSGEDIIFAIDQTAQIIAAISITVFIRLGIGKDDTLFALVDGTVKFERMGKDRKMVSVYPVEQ